MLEKTNVEKKENPSEEYGTFFKFNNMNHPKTRFKSFTANSGEKSISDVKKSKSKSSKSSKSISDEAV